MTQQEFFEKVRQQIPEDLEWGIFPGTQVPWSGQMQSAVRKTGFEIWKSTDDGYCELHVERYHPDDFQRVIIGFLRGDYDHRLLPGNDKPLLLK